MKSPKVRKSFVCLVESPFLTCKNTFSPPMERESQLRLSLSFLRHRSSLSTRMVSSDFAAFRVQAITLFIPTPGVLTRF